jgi:hypothetical protein
MASLYFIHDHHVLKLKLCFMWLILMKPMFAYIALEYGSQLRNFVSRAKYIRGMSCLGVDRVT